MIPLMATCLLCGQAVDAAPRGAALDPRYPDVYDNPALRYLEQPAGQYLLHHACKQVGWDSTEWWACKQPDRPIDEHARFDMACSSCADRWPD